LRAVSTATTAAGIAGTWTVDDLGDFDYESATGTFAASASGRTCRGTSSTARGPTTGDVTGSIAIEGTSLTAATFEVRLHHDHDERGWRRQGAVGAVDRHLPDGHLHSPHLSARRRLAGSGAVDRGDQTSRSRRDQVRADEVDAQP
jgi:hypothetical protein